MHLVHSWHFLAVSLISVVNSQKYAILGATSYSLMTTSFSPCHTSFEGSQPLTEAGVQQPCYCSLPNKKSTINACYRSWSLKDSLPICTKLILKCRCRIMMVLPRAHCVVVFIVEPLYYGTTENVPIRAVSLLQCCKVQFGTRNGVFNAEVWSVQIERFYCTKRK